MGTEALLHISHIKAHSSYQGCINQGQDLPQPGICSLLSQQFLHFSLAFSEAVENDPIQLCSLRPQPGCSAASPASRTLTLVFIRISLTDPHKAALWSPLHEWVVHVQTPPFQTSCRSNTQLMVPLQIFISKLSLHHCSALVLLLKVSSSAWHWNPFRKTTQQQPTTPLKLRKKC